MIGLSLGLGHAIEVMLRVKVTMIKVSISSSD